MKAKAAIRALFGCLFACGSASAQAFLPDWSLEIDSLEYGEYALRSVTLSGGGFQDNGHPARILPLEVAATELRFGGHGQALGPFAFSIEVALDADDFVVQVPRHDMASLSFLEPLIPQLAWVSSGKFEGAVTLGDGEGSSRGTELVARFDNLGFDSPDGLFAGLGLNMDVAAALQPNEPDRITLSGGLRQGELLLYDFYRDFSTGGLDFSGRLELDSPGLYLPEIVLSDDAGLHMALSVRIPPGEDAQPDLHLKALRFVFPESYKRYVESVAATASLDGLETSGEITWRGDWTPGSLGRGSLKLRSVNLVDGESGRFALQNLNADLQTDTESKIEWAGASFGKIDLGGGETVVALGPELIELRQAISVPLFGGTFSLSRLRVRAPASTTPDVLVQADIAGVDIGQVTRALDWPEFEGSLSATIPGVNWAQGVMTVEGELEFAVFGGNIVVSNLAVERPFGVLPSLAADLTIADLDLESVTRTFSFGRIAGRLDGYVNGLRMLDWEPVAFDAWLGTPADDRRHDISRQAVRHLTTLGGGAATTMLTSPVLRLFNNFSYRRLGLGCTLSNNVCQIRGIEDQGEGILIMQGAGIPKISILAYNRSVDWPQLVAELSAIASSESPTIGD